MFKNNPVGFILSLLLVPVFGIGIIIFLVWYLKTRSSKLSITDRDILFEEGLLNKNRSEISIDRIRTVKVKQTFFNRIFGTGTIELYTAGDTAEIIAIGMPDPHRIRDLIKNRQPEVG